MLELKLTLVHVLLFLYIWVGGANYLFLANFQAVPRAVWYNLLLYSKSEIR